MNKNPVSSRLTALPNLVRRNTVFKVSPNVKITAQPQTARVQTTQSKPPTTQVIRSQVIPPRITQSPLPQPRALPSQAIPVTKSPVIQSPQPKGHPTKPGVLRPQVIPKRPSTADYAPRHNNHVHIEKIRNLRGIGRGKALVIVGNGPSINEAPLELLLGHPNIDIMSINKPDPRLWPTKYWAFCDTSQYKRHEDLWKQYDGTIINSPAIYQQRPGSIQVLNKHGNGFSRDLTKGFYIGRSTVYANLQTAHWMEYDNIYLFGVDMNPEGVGGQLWFYGTNPDAPALQRKDRFKLEAEHYAHAANELTAEERAKYTFCSAYNKWPFVDLFNRMDHRLAVHNIIARYGKQHG